MARKSKIEQQKQADSANSHPTVGAMDGTVAPKTKTKVTSSSPKKKKATPKKKAAAVKAVASEKAASRPNAPGPSDEEIRIRAYFLAERRLQLSLPGDSAHDWIEAKRQLIEEAGR